MNRETFETLRAGTDPRPWLVIGGPHDGKRIKPFENAHLTVSRLIPSVNYALPSGIDWAVYRIDHDGHVLEFEPNGIQP